MQQTATQEYTIVKRNGTLVPFRKERISRAIEAAFRDTKKIPKLSHLPDAFEHTIEQIADLVVQEAESMAALGTLLTVEGVQDIVEIKLMDTEHHDVARDYILYREQHKKLRKDSPRALHVLRRDGVSFVRFNPMKVASAIERGFRDTLHILGPTPTSTIDAVNLVTNEVVTCCVEAASKGELITVEWIQDTIEKQLMNQGCFEIAKDYILFRASRATERRKTQEFEEPILQEEIEISPEEEKEEKHQFKVIRKDGSTYRFSKRQLKKKISFACRGYEKEAAIDDLVDHAISQFYDGMKEHEVDLALILAARAKVEVDPLYASVAARLLLDVLYRETLGVEVSHGNLKKIYKKYFIEYFRKAVTYDRLDPNLLSYDLEKLANALVLERDDQFSYLGLQTLYDRYFIHEEGKRLETPQIFWMRVAMGLALNEGEAKEKRAIEFYNVFSQFLYISGTPTLFNSGTCHSQLSSCYLSTVMDNLHHIYKTIADDAQLSKWAGGLGNDWSNVRATGSLIKGTNGKSQGVIPFLKVANDTAVAVNQGGKRKGAMCAYLETWHLDIEDFLELRKNTGDERRRTHDMNTANWIPDLFMKRVMENGSWTLFSPNDVPDLHDLYGQAFETRYLQYEREVQEGKISLFKKIEAVPIWRKMLGMLYETGHPWITFKDPSNIRSSQDHMGIVHSSNLCTEILLNTSEEETAVCNIGSVNLAAHITEKGLDEELLASTIKTAIRMLDNVIEVNFYPIEEAKRANTRHRAIGLGMMGFQDCLYKLNVSYASHEAIEFADMSMEMISYYAILASSELAKERGTYSTYKGSKWERGILPIDSINLLAEERGEEYLDMDTTSRFDWNPVRESIRKYGMRNCNTMAIAPTATIANIVGVTQSIEPMYKHLFVKSNLSGEFTVLNSYLVEKLKSRGLWSAEMLDDLKYFDGSTLEIETIPDDLKTLFYTAFEIDPEWIIECGSRRQKWIDMGQSLNLYLAEPSGKKLDEMYKKAWKKGLKTTYYLRSLGATHIEKSTTDINKRGLQPRWMKSESASSRIVVQREEEAPKACNLNDESCESCQ
ncbi:MAG: Ribonucleoside-diphosphate reductase 1 subunit alpha [Chlamydiae bacterium]|nr:Ribonucleoside-diphosphate reductase 1 subunit alpha [Chlamydiota bacterium]